MCFHRTSSLSPRLPSSSPPPPHPVPKKAKRRIYGLKDEGRQLDSARVALGERLEDCRAKLDRIVQVIQRSVSREPFFLFARAVRDFGRRFEEGGWVTGVHRAIDAKAKCSKPVGEMLASYLVCLPCDRAIDVSNATYRGQNMLLWLKLCVPMLVHFARVLVYSVPVIIRNQVRLFPWRNTRSSCVRTGECNTSRTLNVPLVQQALWRLGVW